MRTLLLALAVSVVPTLAAHAQESEQDVTTLIVQEAITQGTNANSLGADEVFDAIEAFGLSDEEGSALEGFSLSAQGNLALVRQAAFDDLLGGNDASVGQDGDGNLAVLLQQGNNNFTSTLQVGSGNVIGVRLRGLGNSLGTPADPGVLQAGADNVYLLDYEGSNQIIAPTIQEGNGNQVVQIGEIDVPFGVEQRGDGMRMIIRHNGAQ
jgi:hypothetical protein